MARITRTVLCVIVPAGCGLAARARRDRLKVYEMEVARREDELATRARAVALVRGRLDEWVGGYTERVAERFGLPLPSELDSSYRGYRAFDEASFQELPAATARVFDEELRHMLPGAALQKPWPPRFQPQYYEDWIWGSDIEERWPPSFSDRVRIVYDDSKHCTRLTFRFVFVFDNSSQVRSVLLVNEPWTQRACAGIAKLMLADYEVAPLALSQKPPEFSKVALLQRGARRLTVVLGVLWACALIGAIQRKGTGGIAARREWAAWAAALGVTWMGAFILDGFDVVPHVTSYLPSLACGVVLLFLTWCLSSIPDWPERCIGLATAAWERVRRRRNARLFCQKCGYDLAGNQSGECPECGTMTGRARPVDVARIAQATEAMERGNHPVTFR